MPSPPRFPVPLSLGPTGPPARALTHHALSLSLSLTARPHLPAALRSRSLAPAIPLTGGSRLSAPFFLAHTRYHHDHRRPPSFPRPAITPVPVKLGTASSPAHCTHALTQHLPPNHPVLGAVRITAVAVHLTGASPLQPLPSLGRL
jgi:hypothetical protein